MSEIMIVEFGENAGKYDHSDLPRLMEKVRKNQDVLAPTEEMNRLLEFCVVVSVNPVEFIGKNISELKEAIKEDRDFSKSESRRVAEEGIPFVHSDNLWQRPEDAFVIDRNVTWVRIFVPRNGK